MEKSLKPKLQKYDWVSRGLLAVFGAASLVTFLAGIFFHAWWGGLGFVLTITAVICNLIAWLGPATYTDAPTALRSTKDLRQRPQESGRRASRPGESYPPGYGNAGDNVRKTGRDG